MSRKDQDEMVMGYLCGYNGSAESLPDCYLKHSPAFKHGWNNGRDDRIGSPGERASVKRARAEMILRDIKHGLILALVVVLAGCQTLPQPPKVVTKVVTEYRELPSWATEQVANPAPPNQSIRAITESNNRRGETLDYVNCRSRLLAKLGKGEEVSPGECKK